MKSITTFFVFIVTISFASGQNLMQNGGFENTNHFEFWDSNVTVTAASVETVNTEAHSGLWSVEIKSGTSPIGGLTELTQNLLSPSNNINYKLTLWIKDSVTTSNFLGVYGLTGSSEVSLGLDSLNNTAATDADSGRIIITQDFFQNWGRINYYFNSGQGFIGYLLKFEEATSGISRTVYLDDFAITPVPGQSTVQVSSPNGGEDWLVNTQHNVTWSSSNITNVKIDYSTNNGGVWLNVVSSVPAVNSSYSWTIANTPSAECLIRVSDASLASIFDISDSTFVISPILTVHSPNGGEDWTSGEQHNITWTSQNITNVGIDYSTDSGNNWMTVIASTPALGGSYNWTVPNTQSTQTNCLVRISDVSDSLISDISDATFTISPASIVTVTAPNGGENWEVGTINHITWTRQEVSNVRIEYSTDNGNSWTLVVASVLAIFGNYNWTIPNTPSTQCLVRISEVGNASVYDVSDNTFTIEEPVSVDELKSGIPDEYALYQNYPNPFNPSTNIEFAIPNSSQVTIDVFNQLGEKVATILNSILSAGYYKVEFDAGIHTSGLYFYRISSRNFIQTKKMVLMK